MQVRFASRTPLAVEIKKDVDAYLATHNHGAIRRKMVTKTVILLAWSLASYVGLVFFAAHWWQGLLFSTSLGLAMAGVGFGIQHDANHGSYPLGRRWRRALGFCLDVLGGSSYIWCFQHNINHHSFTNVADADADISVGAFARLSPAQPRRAIHRFQYLYLWPLYSLLGLSWLLYADWRDYFASSIGSNHFPPPRGAERAIFWGGKLLWLVVWVIVPLSFQAWLPWFLYATWSYLVLGITLSIVFQMAHIVEEAEFPPLTGEPARTERDFFQHQLATTVNFAPENPLLNWYLAGLNYQVEHHLFPKLCHLHYPAIAPIVRRACEKHGAPYHSLPTFRAALGSHVRWLKRMGGA